MSKEIELIYDKLVAKEKLKSGTKYERIAAIVFKILDREQAVVHDIRLRGDGKETAHQIDVHVRRGKDDLRWIVECRDFAADASSPKIGPGEARDFASVVRDLKPDEAMMVTTVGFTGPAETYAREQKIRLAILREFSDADWEGRVRELRFIGHLFAPSDLKVTQWRTMDDDETRRVQPLLEAQGSWDEEVRFNAHEEYFLDELGQSEAIFAEVIDPIYQEIQRGLKPGVNTGLAELDRRRHIRFGKVLVAVRAFEWEVELIGWTHTWAHNFADQIARLLMRTLDGKIDQAIFERDIVIWEFTNDGEVRPRHSSAMTRPRG